jgi:hypothetical protein
VSAPAGEDDGGPRALQQIVLVARDDGCGDDEPDDHPHERAERLRILHALDHLADQEGLGERHDGPDHAEHGDDDQHARVLPQEGDELAQARAGPVVLRGPAESAAGC